MIDEVPETDQAKEYIEKGMAVVFNVAVKVLEEKKGKAADSCQLPPANPKDQDNTSVFVRLVKAINNLEK